MKELVIAGNWKMNKTRREAVALTLALREARPDLPAAVRLRVFPPFTGLAAVAETAGGEIEVGAQNLHPERAGAFTGEISARMLLEAGAEYVLIGHSERRVLFAEMGSFLAAKMRAALAAGLRPLVCIGERLDDRESERTRAVLTQQLEEVLAPVQPEDGPRLEIAYEPVWAIGTGRVATLAQIADAHSYIRERLVARFGPPGRSVPVLYGGSVDATNAKEILGLDGVDGVLVGGASLEATSFLAIARYAG